MTQLEPAGDSLRARLPEGHVIATLMDEHQRILAKLTRLEELVTEDRSADGVAEEILELATKLIGAEPHHQREEQVLFPALRQRGLAGPPDVMEAEHVELRALKHAVHDDARALLAGTDTWSTLRENALRIAGDLRAHIAKEDEILYPMAVHAIRDDDVWAEMRRRCDEIGYCCHHPGA